MLFGPSHLAFKYCVGEGVEVGASTHNPFNIKGCRNVAPSNGVDYVYEKDIEDYLLYKNAQLKLGGEVAQVDLVGDFRHLPVPDASLDYIISSHVIEHEPNPIAVYVESYRALKEGGVFFCIFPKRNAATLDACRPLTTLDQFLECFKEDVTPLKSSQTWRQHYHVYSLQSMLKLINWINISGLAYFQIEAVEETDSKIGNGHTVVLRKTPKNNFDVIINKETIEYGMDSDLRHEALIAAKTFLSKNFFNPDILYLAALLSVFFGEVNEGKEFYRQALVLKPESEYHRNDFFKLFGEYYQNPII